VRGGAVRRLEIAHNPWPLQPAEAAFERNEAARAAGVRLPEVPPVVHFAGRLDVRFWPPRKVFAGRNAPTERSSRTGSAGRRG